MTDGENVYVFFGDFGLLAYSNKDGAELWRLALEWRVRAERVGTGYLWSLA